MKNTLLSAGIIVCGLVVSSFLVANGVFAQTADIHYPVAELGSCKDKEACKAYCDDPSHIDACVTFAEKNGLMSQEQLTEAKQVQMAIANGVKPPACKGKEACDAYCEDSSHMKECIAFGEASGFLKGKELEDAKKMITAIDNGATPPACKGKEACDAYCSDRNHIEACMTFALAAGLMTPEEAQNSDKMLTAIKKGFKPPNCSGKEACDAYCAEPAHTDECIQFSVAAGFMTDKEAEMAKKTGGKGPGGCVGKDACDTFCNNPGNQQTCIDFGKENGMISAEDATRMQEGQQKFKESMQNLSPETADCMKTVLGSDTFEKIKNGQTMPPKDMPDKVGSCFSKAPPVQRGPGEGGNIPPAGQGQPVPQEQQTPGTQFVPRTEMNQQPSEGQPPSSGQFAPNTYPNQPPPEGTSGAYLTQPTQYAPGTQPVAPTSGGTAPPPPPPSTAPGAGGEIAPGTSVPQVQPIEQTAPQSSNFDLKSSLAAVASFFSVSF